MLAITNCETVKTGNLLKWDTANWYLNSSRGTARMEMLEYENDVCAPRTMSLHLIPYKLTFDPESLHMCTKFSGKIAQYSKKDKFDKITTFLRARQHMKTEMCTLKVKDKEAWRFRSWLANDDREVEGAFENWYTNE